ncbi:hypothetical protein [Actibacterium sp. D379-3]
MTTIFKSAAFCLAVLPTAALAQTYEPTDDELQTFRDAIIEIGCTIDTDARATAVETATGYDEEVLEAIVEKLRIYQEIVDASEQGGITLLSGDCTN